MYVSDTLETIFSFYKILKNYYKIDYLYSSEIFNSFSN